MEKDVELQDPYEVRIRFDWSNEIVRAWFYGLIARTRHPQYQGGIRVQRPQRLEETTMDADAAQAMAPGKPRPRIPHIGAAVHYVSHGTPVRPDGTQAFTATCRSAEVTEVNAEEPLQAGLLVKNPTGLFFHPLAEGGCFQSESPGGSCNVPPESRRGGTWHWPEIPGV
jgi:hypothetical protein